MNLFVVKMLSYYRRRWCIEQTELIFLIDLFWATFELFKKFKLYLTFNDVNEPHQINAMMKDTFMNLILVLFNIR